MTALDDRERRITYWVAAVAAGASVALWAPGFDEQLAIVLAAAGVALAGLLALAARSRRRLLTCLAAVLLGFGPWGVAWVLGLPYIALATWLVFRDRKATQAAQTRDDDDAESSSKATRKARRQPSPRREREPHSGPQASKRYTPPRKRR